MHYKRRQSVLDYCRYIYISSIAWLACRGTCPPSPTLPLYPFNILQGKVTRTKREAGRRDDATDGLLDSPRSVAVVGWVYSGMQRSAWNCWKLEVDLDSGSGSGSQEDSLERSPGERGSTR